MRKLILAFALIAIPKLAFAHADGTQVVGNSGKNPNQTCNSNSCHFGGSVSTVSVSGPKTLAAGEVGQYTFLIVNNNANAVNSGADIAVDNGTLAAGDATEALVSNEVVHKMPVKFAGGMASYKFSLTAPSTPGTVTIYAQGMQGDVDDDSAGDLATGTTYQVSVTGTGGGSPTNGSNGNSGNMSQMGGCSTVPGAQPIAGGAALALFGLALLARRVLRRRA
jgi:hypothetical protein